MERGDIERLAAAARRAFAAVRAVNAQVVAEQLPARPASSAEHLPCPYRGEPTGDRVVCRSCGDRLTLLKVLACSIHGSCLLQHPGYGHACCAGCTDRPPAA